MALTDTEERALAKTREILEALVALAHQCGVPETAISTVYEIYRFNAMGMDYPVPIGEDGQVIAPVAPPGSFTLPPDPMNTLMGMMAPAIQGLVEDSERRRARDAAREEAAAAKRVRAAKKAKKS
jgi:hypothetical protein